MEKERHFIEHNGDCWQSVFPSESSHLSQLHVNVSDAFVYMTKECNVRENIVIVNPYRK